MHWSTGHRTLKSMHTAPAFILAALALTYSIQSSNAEGTKLPASMWSEECTVQKTFDSTLINHVDAGTPHTAKTLAAVREMLALMESRDFEAGKPMADQMDAYEAAQFEALNQQIKNGQVITLIEGKRERDLWAISRMVSIAHELSRDAYQFSDDKKEMSYAALLLAMRELIELENLQPDQLPTEGPCVLESAIYADASRAFENANKVYGLDAALADLQSLADEYGTPLAREKLSAADARRMDEDILPVVTKAQARLELARDLYRIARLEVVSKLSLEATRRDQYAAPSDIEYMGTNWDMMVKTEEISAQDIQYAKVLFQLNEMIPAEIMESWEKSQAELPK